MAYYVLLHPDEAPWATVSDELPSVADLRARAEHLAWASKNVPSLGRLDPRPGKGAEWSARVGWFYRMHGVMYPPAFGLAFEHVRGRGRIRAR